MVLNAIKITQPLGDFYITKIKAKDLLQISTSSVLRYDKDGNLKGNQRPLKPERLKMIANFIKSEEMCFPSSIIVAANVDEKGLIEDDEKRWKIEHIENDFYTLIIPDEKIITSLIIDGQHRLNAFSLVKDYQDIELVCSIFFDLPSPYQAYLFATINGNQKRVDKSLSLELFGYSVEEEPQNTWSPEKLAVYLTRKFNFKKESPLYQRIKLAPLYTEIEDKVDKTKWLLSTAAMVDGILSLISANPQRDRDMLAMKKDSLIGDKTRKCLSRQKDNTVLRTHYLNCNDDEIYNVLDSFFKSVKTILWDSASQHSVIVKTIGISVLFEILKEILKKNENTKNYDDYILKIKDVDYEDNYFQFSGNGKTRLRRILKYKLGFITEMDLEEEDLQHLNNYDRDIDNATKEIARNPNNAEAYYLRGNCYLKRGDYDMAISDFTKALEINPNNAEIYSLRGAAYSNKGSYPKAISDLTKAIEINHNIAEIYFLRGNNYYCSGNYFNARLDYSKALELKTNDLQQDNFNINMKYLEILKQNIERDRTSEYAQRIAQLIAMITNKNTSFNTDDMTPSFSLENHSSI